jgi:hypothetical protein
MLFDDVTQPDLDMYSRDTLVGSGKGYFAHRITYFIYILSLFPFTVPLIENYFVIDAWIL